MKRFEAFLTEKETEAHKKAVAMGLEYRGFGYWADRQTGKVTHRSSGDELTEVGGGLEAAGGPGEMPTSGDGSVADMATGASMGETPMGEVKPGEEKAPRDTNWEPGPDGSTDVGQDKDTVEGDVFVGKNNQAGWEAGPGGSNITNWSFDQFQEAALSEGAVTDMADILFGSNPTAAAKKVKKEKRGKINSGRMPAAQEAKLRNLTSDGHGMWFDSKGTPVARTIDGELVFLSPKERDMEQAKIVARNMRKAPGVEMSGDQDARDGGAFMQKIPAGKRTNMMHDYLRDKGLAPEVVDPKFNPMAANAKVPAPGTPATPEPEGSDAGFPGREKQLDLLKKGEAPRGGEKTFADAKAALDKLSPEDREKVLASIARTKDDPFVGKKQGEYTKGMKAYKDIQKLPQKGKDIEKVKAMNEASQQFLSDPSFDLGEDNREQEIGSGAFGTVYLSQEYDTPGGKDQAIIKDGDIGRDELEALFLMKDHPAFPTLINAEFTTPFKHQSSAYNNPMGRESQAADTQGRYFVPGEEYDFERKFVTARGSYAMSMAAGDSVSDVLYGIDEVTHETIADNFWNARADLHKAGISHGDMHGGNIFVDDENNVSILDLGLAQVSSMAALMEAFAGLTEEDYQLSSQLSRNYLSQEQFDKLEENYEKVKSMIWDEFEADIEAGEFTNEEVANFLCGGIRMSEEELGELMLRFDFEEDYMQELLDTLYDGFGQPKPKSKKQDLEDRMAAAWEGLWDEVGARENMSGEMARTTVRNANYFRQGRGEGEIGVKGLDANDDD